MNVYISFAGRKRAEAKKKKLGKSKSTDTEEEEGDDDQDDGELYFSLLSSPFVFSARDFAMIFLINPSRNQKKKELILRPVFLNLFLIFFI